MLFFVSSETTSFNVKKDPLKFNALLSQLYAEYGNGYVARHKSKWYNIKKAEYS